MANSTTAETKPEELRPQDYQGPENKRGVKVQGYCLVEYDGEAPYKLKTRPAWATRILRPGDNVLNVNLYEMAIREDAEFAAMVEAGTVRRGRDFQPAAERVGAEWHMPSEAAPRTQSAEVRALEARIATLEALLTEPPKGGKK